MKTTKNYIIEGLRLNPGTNITLLQEDGNGFNNLLIDKDGSILSEEDFRKSCQPIIDELNKRELISKNNPVKAQEDIIRFCKVEFARYFRVPTVDKVISYLGNRQQSFATN